MIIYLILFIYFHFHFVSAAYKLKLCRIEQLLFMNVSVCFIPSENLRNQFVSAISGNRGSTSSSVLYPLASTSRFQSSASFCNTLQIAYNDKFLTSTPSRIEVQTSHNVQSSDNVVLSAHEGEAPGEDINDSEDHNTSTVKG